MAMTDQLRMTDEELVLLAGEHEVVAAPYLDRLQASERSVALTVAYRALIAHGVAREDGSLAVPDHLVHLLRCRQDADSVLMLVGVDTVSETIAARYFHRLDLSWLVEDVAADGIHEFSVATDDELEAAVREWVEPLDPVAAQGVRQPLMEADQPWGEVRFRLDITLWQRNASADRLIGVLGGAAGTWLTDVVPGTPGEIELQPTDLSGIVAAVVSLTTPQAQ